MILPALRCAGFFMGDRQRPAYSLIFVDDEDIVREGISSRIDWGGNGFTLAGTFPDGLAAVEPIIRGRLPFRRYEALNSLALPSLERGHGKTSITPEHVFEYWVDVVDTELRTADLRYSVSRTDPARRETAALLEGSARIQEATPLVLGGVPFYPVNQGSETRKMPAESYLIIVVEMALPAPSAAAE